MTPTTANIRGTFFTNKSIELDYEKAMKVVSILEQYRLFAFPVSGFSFQIGPGGMVPVAMNGFEFRNRENKLNISIGPDRVDINSYIEDGEILKAFTSMSAICQNVINAFASCIEFKVVRLALASTWNISFENLDFYSARYLELEDTNTNHIVEWDKRIVERKVLEENGLLVNYGRRIARATIKLPAELMIKDRIIAETDINSIPVPPDKLDEAMISSFYKDAVSSSDTIIRNYFKIVNNE